MPRRTVVLALALAALSASAAHAQQQPPAPPAADSIRTPATGAFAFDLRLTLPGAPAALFDAFTGRTLEWWDHTFSPNPARLYFDTEPGGGFWERFDAEGNGAMHARVIYAQRGRMLRFDGPLGLSGTAIQMVHTLEFEPAPGDSTRVKLSVHAAGEMQAGLPRMVQGVWRHFLFERFKPYVEGGFRPLPRPRR